MIEWVKQDLKKANENRATVPWIIVTGHVPIYCKGSSCDNYPTLYKDFEDLFYKYGVDLFIGAHKHQY